MIRLENVTKSYKGSTVALRDASVDISKGEFVFLVGPSGSGKSTFLRLLTKEEEPDGGIIWVAGKDIGKLSHWKVPYLRRNIGHIFQDFQLLPNKTVYENVAFTLQVIGRPKHVIKSQVPQILDLVGLTKKMENLPHELSGGEQQRVSIARAFVNRPLILLADEPTGNLDPNTSTGIMRLLDRINRTGTTVVMATHDQGIVDSMRRRVIELDRGTVVRDQARGVYGVLHLMAISVGYVVKETATNLKRNIFTTVGAIVTVAVSLVLLGGALLSIQAVHKQTARWRGGIELSIFMKPESSQSQIDAVKSQLDSTPGVKKVTYVDKPAALNEMKDLFANQPNVVETLTEETAPPSFRVVPTKAELTETIGTKFNDQPGVREVVYAKEAIRSLVKTTNEKNRVFLILAAVVLGSAILLILNSIQQAIFARRREIEVMKRVGATNWFIRVPFMLEGLLQGLVGSILAFGVVYLGRNVAILLGTDPAFGSSINKLFVTGSEVVGTGLLMVLVGAMVGAFGSAFAVRRFLDV